MTSAVERAAGNAAAEAPAREGQTLAGESLPSRYASFVKLPHTLFALPFAGVGVILASRVRPDAITLGTVLWIVLAFTAARFAAMGFNRIVDRRWDALNPRTRNRELPAGRLSVAQASSAVAVASIAFIFASWRLNSLCGWLSPLALGWVFLYSYTKRFTSWSHVVLGFALGIAPAGAYLAVTGRWTDPWWALVALAGAVTFWVAGFDIIYAVQDEAFDRERGLHSVPARLGSRSALGLARALHLLAVGAFLALWWMHVYSVSWLYLVGVTVMAVLLHFAHASLRGRPAEAIDFNRIDRAFFHTNVGVSTSFFVLTLADRLLFR